MQKLLRVLIALPMLLALSVGANATTITTNVDFESVAITGKNAFSIGEYTFTQLNYYTFTDVADAVNLFDDGGNNVLTDSIPGASFGTINGAAIFVTRTAGGAFSLDSFDTVELVGGPGTSVVQLGLGTGTDGLGQLVGGVGINSFHGAGTQSGTSVANGFYLNIVNFNSANQLGVDNLVLSYETGVPAPATLGILMLGLVFAGMRRRA